MQIEVDRQPQFLAGSRFDTLQLLLVRNLLSECVHNRETIAAHAADGFVIEPFQPALADEIPRAHVRKFLHLLGSNFRDIT